MNTIFFTIVGVSGARHPNLLREARKQLNLINGEIIILTNTSLLNQVQFTFKDPGINYIVMKKPFF